MKKLVLFIFIPIFISCFAEGAKGMGEVELEEVVVTATKTTEKRKDVPNSMVLMDEMDIQNSPAKSVGELLSGELGLDWRTYGNYGGATEEIHIRGMGGNATKILVNGVSVNSASTGTADASRIPLNSIERIEVVKGSGSLLYGSGAMGGTINIITKAPKKDRVTLKAGAGYGSEDTYLISAEHGMFIGNGVGYFLTANRKETEGFRDNSDLDHRDFSMKLVWDKGDAFNVSLYGDLIDRDYGRPGVDPPKGVQRFSIDGKEVYNNESGSLLDKGSDEDAHAILQVKSRPLEWLGFSLRGDYTYMENYNYVRYVDWLGSLSGNKSWVTNQVLGVEGNIDARPFEGMSILLGVERKEYDWKNKSWQLDGTGSKVSGSKSEIDADLHTTGTYVEAQYRPCRLIKLLAGIRHEDHYVFGTETLPLWGLIINPLEDTTLKLSHGKHFLAPTPNDLFWPFEDYDFYSFGGNPDLDPETGWHTDVTIEQAFLKGKFFLTASYVHWDVNDKIQWESDSNWHYGPVNLDIYEADVWEVGTKIGPFHDLILALNYTNTDAEEKNDFVTRQALYTPEHQFKGSLTYWTDFGLTATATVRFVGDRPYYGGDKTISSSTRTLDSYWTSDIKLELCLFDHWNLSLSCNNLLDEEYDTYLDTFVNQTTGETTVAGYPGAGSSVFFSLAYEF